MQMNVSVPPRMYDFVQGKVKSGMYSNASEVVRDALRMLDKKQSEADSWTILNELLLQAEKSGRSELAVGEIVEEVVQAKN